MPRKKRTAPESDTEASGSTPKRVATGCGPATTIPKPKPKPPRWAKFSVSANLSAEYNKVIHTEKATPGQFVCLCELPFSLSSSSSPSPENSENPPPPCDGGKTCICGKPAPDSDLKTPETHKWILTSAGRWKFFQTRNHSNIRDPQNFGMYTYNDHAAHGVLETVQNLMMDFVEALVDEETSGGWKLKWAVIEALGFFLMTDEGSTCSMIDDGDLADWTYRLTGRMFLSMLTFLETKSLLGPNSQVKNLPLIMTIWIKIAQTARNNFDLLAQSKKELILPKADRKYWFPHRFEDQILAYAVKYDIPLPFIEAKDIAQVSKDVDLPVFREEEPTITKDAFGFEKEFARYVKESEGITAFMSKRKQPPKSKIGGDSLDITSWTRAERKKFSHEGKDPLGKTEVDAIRNGEILMVL